MTCAGARPLVVIDAGANGGDYTGMVFELAAAAGCVVEVHAFEPSMAARERLLERFQHEKRLVVIGKALGERPSVATLYQGAEGSTQASLLVRPVLGAPTDGVPVEVTTLGRYLDENKILRVDLLKLDVEGYEMAALRGLGEALVPHRVANVQFEYGGATLDAGVTLRQLYALLQARGYRVAKLLPSGLMVRDYAPWMDHFNYANYVAVARGESP